MADKPAKKKTKKPKGLFNWMAPKIQQPTGAGARRDAKLLKAEKEALGIK
jgi:hypothetical protein